MRNSYTIPASHHVVHRSSMRQLNRPKEVHRKWAEKKDPCRTITVDGSLEAVGGTGARAPVYSTKRLYIKRHTTQKHVYNYTDLGFPNQGSRDVSARCSAIRVPHNGRRKKQGTPRTCVQKKHARAASPQMAHHPPPIYPSHLVHRAVRDFRQVLRVPDLKAHTRGQSGLRGLPPPHLRT